MERFDEKYFTETYKDKTRKGKLRLPAGGQGRKRNYMNVSAFFKFAVSKGISEKAHMVVHLAMKTPRASSV